MTGTRELAPAALGAWSRIVATGPGVVLACLAAAVAFALTRVLPAVSALLVAILLGILVRNLLPLPQAFEPGLELAAKRLLRLGIVLLGMQLVLGDVLALGPGMIAVVILIVGTGIGATLLAGRRLGISPAQRLLIACGFSICGAAAVAAVDGVIKTRKDEEVATAIALVVLFGTLMIPVVPLVADALGLGEVRAGMLAGGSVHEVAQVVAAGSAIGGPALATAVVVKLARVLLLAPVLAAISLRQWLRMRASGVSGGPRAAHGPGVAGASGASAPRPPIVPLFVVGFLAMVLLRSTGAVPAGLVDTVGIVQTALLSAAMFALGTGVRVSMFRRVGVRPFVLAAISTLVVMAVSIGGVLLAGR